MSLTKVGKSVISLLDGYDERSALESFGRRMDKANVIRVMVGKYAQGPNNEVTIIEGELIFPQPVFYSFGSRANDRSVKSSIDFS